MNYTTKISLTLCLFPLTLLPAQAQVTDNEDTSQQTLEKITVYGEKTKAIDKWAELTTDFDRSYSIETVYSDELDEKNIINVKDALKGMANVRVKDQGAFNKSVALRGMGSERTIFLIDGVKVSNQGLTHSGAGEANLTDINQIERIEVVKGSPSVLYDPGATGGVVNIINKNTEVKDHFSGKYRYSQDAGYISKGHAISLSGAKNSIGGRIFAAKNKSDGYKIKDKEKLAKIIQHSNEQQDRTDTDYAYTGLGYSDNSYGANVYVYDEDFGKLSFSHAQYEAQDMTFTHGASTSQIFRTDSLIRKNTLLQYSYNFSRDWKPLILAYSQSSMDKKVVLNETSLTSKQINLVGGINAQRWDLDFGAQYTKDDADTNVRATQDYWAVFASASYYWQRMSITAGLRANYWSVDKLFRPTENKELRCQLEGAVGCLKQQNDFEPTYSFGSVYHVNDEHNITFNYARSHRQPSLYERIAFDSFWGCFDKCEPEHGDNYELAWKWMNSNWYASINMFASLYDTYINTKEVRKLTNPAALESCIRRGKCDPRIGEFNNQERDFFSSNIRYYTSNDVDNLGSELMLRYQSFTGTEAAVNLSFNKVNADDPFVGYLSQPWELGLNLKHKFNAPLSPWVMLEYRWLTDAPSVKQEEGFSPFSVLNFYLGAQYKTFTINAGLRNLTDAQYHEPYTALDGLTRSAFFNISAAF